MCTKTSASKRSRAEFHCSVKYASLPMCCQCGWRSLRLSSELITVVSQCGLNNFSRIAACCFLPGQLKIKACTRIIPPQELLCRGSYQVSKLQQYDIFLYGGRFETVAGNGFEWTEVNFYSHSDGGGFSVLSSAP